MIHHQQEISLLQEEEEPEEHLTNQLKYLTYHLREQEQISEITNQTVAIVGGDSFVMTN